MKNIVLIGGGNQAHYTIDIIEKETAISNKAPLSQIKVLPFKEKKEWILSAKYNIGKKIVKENGQDENTEV